jgi:UDP-glucose:(heptosyl)LPS alpha-1,3-glucosyltransferase
MRVAIIKSSYAPYGGAEKYAARMIGAFAARNVQVDVLTAESGDWGQTSLDARLVSLKQVKYNNLLRLLTFDASVGRYLQKEKYDCILGMDRTSLQTHLRAGGGVHAAWIARRCDESSRLRCMSFKVNPFHRAMIEMERKAFLSPGLRRIFCNSHLVENEIAGFYPGASGKVTVVHNGIEWDELSEAFSGVAAMKSSIVRGLGLNSGRYYFLFVGNGFERKGLRKAISALKLLPDHVDLLVVGKDKNEKAYRTLAGKSGLEKRVHFFGLQRNVVPFFQAADAFILPTIYDPFSNASLEALAMGLYLVTSSANGCCEVIDKGAGCIIQDLRDTGSVAEAMNRALKDHISKDRIRESVRHLDFTTQLNRIVDMCIEDGRK